MVERVEKSDREWRAQLTPEQYAVARQGGTERAFTGCFWDTKTEGTYACVCCGTPLFRSDTKYESGSGWPSFWRPVSDDAIAEEAGPQPRHGPHRGQVRRLRTPIWAMSSPTARGRRACANCINSASLTLVPDAENAERKPGGTTAV